MNQKSNQNFEWRFPEESRWGINFSKGPIFRGSFDKENEGDAHSLPEHTPKGNKIHLISLPIRVNIKVGLYVLKSPKFISL